MIETRFQKGLAEVPTGKVNEVRRRLMDALGVRERHAYYNYRDGKVRLTIEKWCKIQAVFAEYGITAPWGGKDD
jgi:hypothetical protein